MVEWIEKSLGEIAEVTKLAGFEFTKHIKYNSDGEIIALRALNLRNGELDLTDIKRISREVSERLTRSKIYKDDILLTYTGNGYGDCAIIEDNDKYHLAPNICKIVPNNKEVFPYYLYCYIRSKAFYNQMSNNMTGSGQPTIPMKTIRLLKVPVPEMSVQINVANMIWLLNQKIRNNRAINNNLEQQARALYKSWFIDFEPFGGVMPIDWRTGQLKDILKLKRNSIKAGQNTELPYLPIDVIPMKTFAISEFKLNEEAKSSLVTFSKNDIIIGAMRVYFHRVVLAPCDGITRTTCFTLVPHNPEYLSYCLLCCDLDSSIEYAQTTSKGSTMPYAIWDGGLGDMEISIPSLKVAKEFNDVILPMLEKIQSSYYENTYLKELRDSLLSKLMSGDIDVSRVEI